MNPRCPKCGCLETEIVWQRFEDNTTHLRATCAACHAFVGYATQTPGNLARAGEPPPTKPREADGQRRLF